MNVARRDQLAVYHEDYIYVIGGWSTTSHITDVERFNMDEDTWETLPHLPVDCSATSAVVFDNKVLVYAEESVERRYLGYLMLFQPESRQWDVLLSEGISSSSSLRVLIPPLLVLHQQRCYRVAYVSGVASVQQIHLTTIDGKMEATLGRSQNVVEQKNVGKTGARFFCIDEARFANLRGYAYLMDTEGVTVDMFADLLRDLNVCSPCACFIEMSLDVHKLGEGNPMLHPIVHFS